MNIAKVAVGLIIKIPYFLMALYSLLLLSCIITLSCAACPPSVLLFTHTSSITSTTSRQAPSINCNQEGWVIQTYRHHLLRTSYYRVGKLQSREKGIDWTGEEQEYTSGKHSQIILNDRGLVLETFESYSLWRCWYRVGWLEGEVGTIQWMIGPSIFANGRKPSSTLNERGVVLVTFERGWIRRDAYYRIGDIDNSNGIICWRANEIKLLNRCSDVSPSLNDHGIVILSARTYQHSFIILTGTINSNDNTISFRSIPDPSSRLGSSAYASAALNNHGHLVWVKMRESHVTILTGRQLHTSLLNSSVPSQQGLRINSASLLNTAYRIRHPSVCVSNNNVVIFTCYVKHGLFGCSKVVFTSIGKLMPEDRRGDINGRDL